MEAREMAAPSLHGRPIHLEGTAKIQKGGQDFPSSEFSMQSLHPMLQTKIHVINALRM